MDHYYICVMKIEKCNYLFDNYEQCLNAVYYLRNLIFGERYRFLNFSIL